ncbi:MAG: hypothetical protein Q7U14_02795, partial [Lacisediminimonas sp.]|nr:hypothetical protein [Lacisediminimonas sp.]
MPSKKKFAGLSNEAMRKDKRKSADCAQESYYPGFPASDPDFDARPATGLVAPALFGNTSRHWSMPGTATTLRPGGRDVLFGAF